MRRETRVNETKSERRARSVLARDGVRQPPVPVDEIAGRLGITVVYNPSEEEVAGVLYRDGDSVSMIVNSSSEKSRQRFTVAHEIGHFLLHRGEVFLDKRVRVNLLDTGPGLATAFEEIQANQFAAELLMPREWMIEEVDRRFQHQRQTSEDDLLDGLAEHFSVSWDAVEYRLANLGAWGPL